MGGAGPCQPADWPTLTLAVASSYAKVRMVMTMMKRGAGLQGAAVVMLGLMLPVLHGLSCGQPAPVQPGAGNAASSVTAPRLVFTSPVVTLVASVGDRITITWVDDDPTGTAVITLLLDPDDTLNNGNEILAAPLLLAGTDTNPQRGEDLVVVDTGVLRLQERSYRIIARLNDGIHPEQIIVAPGRLDLRERFLPSNRSPSLVVTAPQYNLSLGQGANLQITYCGSDPDDDAANPRDSQFVPDIVILLDEDDDPTNDLNLSGPLGEDVLADVCFSDKGFPLKISGAIVIGCFKDDDCADPTQPTGAAGVTIDLQTIPPLPGGRPYHARGTMWDHTNPPVHSYAPGTVTVAANATGIVDLSTVGRSVAGARFQGFDVGGRAGYTGAGLSDFDGDGANDFIIVARYGDPFGRGNVGSAYLIYGIKGRRFSGDVSLNSFGGAYRGAIFAMGSGACSSYLRLPEYRAILPKTEGLTSVAAIKDLSGDGKPEILFGAPLVPLLYDNVDDDPCDDNNKCYLDLQPNPKSNENGNDDLGCFDLREGQVELDVGGQKIQYLCSNDDDLSISSPISQGYIFYVRSDNSLDGNVLDLALLGQTDPGTIASDEGTLYSGSAAPRGARFRGGAFGTSSSNTGVVYDNDFGRTVGSLPDIGNGDIDAGLDGRDELLMSSPKAYNGRGSVFIMFGGEYASFGNEVQSIPRIDKLEIGGGCFRQFLIPAGRNIIGAQPGDNLGYAAAAGDFNLDGNQDLLMGAPGADRAGITDAGIVYILLGRLDLPDLDLSTSNPPRIEIRGTRAGDKFGTLQSVIGDINRDGLADIGFASQFAGDDGPGGVDSGFIGIVFGGRQITGENSFTVDQVATAQLPGVKFYGSQPNGHAGALLSNAGDFNGDGTDDILIVAADEVRTLRGQRRRGVAYVILGGPHLRNKTYNLNQVGTSQLPGLVFVSPYTEGTADDAPLDWAGAAGDLDGDGFGDILIGVSTADYVNPTEPSQRRVDAGEVYLIYGNNSGFNSTGN